MPRLAIIGGGASGLIAAHKLQSHFDITVFEKARVLGGNVRTLNGNVKTSAVPERLKLESGVLGFHQQSSPELHAFFDEIGVEIRTGQPTASLYRGGHYYPSNSSDLLTPNIMLQLLRRPRYARGVASLRADYAASFRRITRWDGATEQSVESLYGDNHILNDFIQSLLALAFSSPFDDAGSIPASFARQYLKTLRYPDWSYVKGGNYSYLDLIVSKGQFQIETDCGDIRLHRRDTGVSVATPRGEFEADAVLLAVTPGQILSLLEDPDATEHALFSAWTDRQLTTLSHTDMRFYAPFGASKKTPMDLFVDHPKGVRGYNTSLNQFCGLPGGTPYSFALGMDDAIKEDAVLDRVTHTVPVYTVDGINARDDIRQRSGTRNTYFAGAWLYNGLHEGAARSARIAAERLIQSIGG